jgi:TRAP-type C4-dicarboxylate transport system permease small subunit
MAENSKTHGAVVFFDRVIRWLALFGGATLLAMVMFTVVDVTMRKFSNYTVFGFTLAPIEGGNNISEMALLVVVFSAMAYCGRTGGHVAVDLIENANPNLLRVTDTITNVIGAVIFAILTWWSLKETEIAYSDGRISNMLAIRHWPFYLWIAIGAGLYCIVQCLAAWRAWTAPPGK